MVLVGVVGGVCRAVGKPGFHQDLGGLGKGSKREKWRHGKRKGDLTKNQAKQTQHQPVKITQPYIIIAMSSPHPYTQRPSFPAILWNRQAWC